MRRRLTVLIIFALSLLPMTPFGPPSLGASAASVPGIGKTQLVQGFAVTLVSVTRAHEAGSADYVPGKGNIFVFATMKLQRKGSHDSYTATPLDFAIMNAKGTPYESDQFGVAQELVSKGVHNSAVVFCIGFEVPANDKTLQLYWQPSLASNPDAQAVWNIGTGGTSVQYLH
jgi:hypothetical protein